MRSKRLFTLLFSIVSVSFTLVFAAGFAYAIVSATAPRPSNVEKPEPPQAQGDPRGDGQYRLLALGDSLSKGTGDATGEGYAGKVKKRLEKAVADPVYFTNFAVNGYRTEQLLRDLRERRGTIVEVQNADTIVFTIGGNDLFQVDNPAQLEVDPASALVRFEETAGRVRDILARLAELNPHAEIVHVGLYNPFMKLEDAATARGASSFVFKWNETMQQVALEYPNVTLVPVYDLFQHDPVSFLSGDRYHPNAAGYERVAERVFQVLAAGRGAR